MRKKLNDLRAELLCLEIELSEAEEDAIVIEDLCELLSIKEKELEDNIKFVKKSGIITVASEYKKNKERLANTKEKIYKQKKEKIRLDTKIEKLSNKKNTLLEYLVELYDSDNISDIGEYIERKRKTNKN